MTEAEARIWLLNQLHVSRETLAQLEEYVALVLAENERQNLISEASVSEIWRRHVVDSAQLLPLGNPHAAWADIGSGPGFPGVVLALLGVDSILLVEPRKRRTDFLRRVIETLGLRNCTVAETTIERLRGRSADIITARAVGSLDLIFARSLQLAKPDTRWILPKGRSALAELEAAKQRWTGTFEVANSVTNAESYIIVASGVGPKRA